METLTIETTERRAPGEPALVRLAGVLDAAGGKRMYDACAPFRSDPRQLVLNLKAVTFVSSSGIGVLLALTEEFRDVGGSLRIAEPSAVALMAIQLLNLDQYLDIRNDEADACRRAA